MHDGADHEPSGKRDITRPEPAFPEKTKPALRTWKTARPTFVKEGVSPRSQEGGEGEGTSRTLQNDLGNRVESRFRVIRISF